jgi:hypothetical protein
MSNSTEAIKPSSWADDDDDAVDATVAEDKPDAVVPTADSPVSPQKKPLSDHRCGWIINHKSCDAFTPFRRDGTPCAYCAKCGLLAMERRLIREGKKGEAQTQVKTSVSSPVARQVMGHKGGKTDAPTRVNPQSSTSPAADYYCIVSTVDGKPVNPGNLSDINAMLIAKFNVMLMVHV